MTVKKYIRSVQMSCFVSMESLCRQLVEWMDAEI